MAKGFRKNEIEKLAKAGIAEGASVITNGLSCWRAVETAGCRHWPMVTGSGRPAARWALGNIKAALAGTYHHVTAKHAQRYLASFAWRFNRRYLPDTATERLAWAFIHAQPQPYRVIAVG